MIRSLKTLLAASVCMGVLTISQVAQADAPPAPLLPIPSSPPPVGDQLLELPPASGPTYADPQPYGQASGPTYGQPYVDTRPYLESTPYAGSGYQPDNAVGPNYLPPQPLPSHQPPVQHQSHYGPVVGGPVVGGPVAPPVHSHGHGARYISPESLVLPGHGHNHRVRYKDLKNTHPFSIRQTLFVPSICGCGEIGVDVCAPPNCAVVKVKRNGRKVEYDYGDYEVDIIQKKDGEILVDYDD